MKIVPLTFKDACTYIKDVHRHHAPPQGHKFSIGLELEGKLIGVACIGRPVARGSDNGRTAEVTRLCTDGTQNACSKLYGSAARIAKEMGYTHIITYILAEEPGVSLKAVGWTKEAEVKGRSWSSKKRPRVDKHPTTDKVRYGRAL